MTKKYLRSTKENAYYLCTVHKVETVLYSMRSLGTLWTPSWTSLAHFASISCVQFFSLGSWYPFCDTRSQMKRWRFSVYYRFVYSFSRSFQFSFFLLIGKFPFKDNGICRCYVNNAFCTLYLFLWIQARSA